MSSQPATSSRVLSFPRVLIQGAETPQMARTSLDVALSFLEDVCDAESGVEQERQITLSCSELTCHLRWTPPFGDLIIQWWPREFPL